LKDLLNYNSFGVFGLDCKRLLGYQGTNMSNLCSIMPNHFAMQFACSHGQHY